MPAEYLGLISPAPFITLPAAGPASHRRGSWAPAARPRRRVPKRTVTPRLAQRPRRVATGGCPSPLVAPGPTRAWSRLGSQLQARVTSRTARRTARRRPDAKSRSVLTMPALHFPALGGREQVCLGSGVTVPPAKGKARGLAGSVSWGRHSRDPGLGLSTRQMCLLTSWKPESRITL